MQKTRIAVCIDDRVYGNRLVSCLMKHYQTQVELHVFDAALDVLAEEGACYDVYLFAGDRAAREMLVSAGKVPLVCLVDEGDGTGAASGEAADDDSGHWEGEEDETGDVCLTKKYQEVGTLMEEVLSHAGTAESPQPYAPSARQGSLVAVYSLSDGDGQLPFAITLGSILSERQRVLLVDLQEDSGFSQMLEEPGTMGLEDLLLMADSGNFRKGRAMSCIGHQNGMDFVYPPDCIESLLQVDAGGYRRLFAMLAGEMDYDVVVLNLGTRFPGFLETLSHCAAVYVFHRPGGMGRWREQEFMEELEAKGYGDLKERICLVELPVRAQAPGSMERLVEEWKWNELGDAIRRMAVQGTANG